MNLTNHSYRGLQLMKDKAGRRFLPLKRLQALLLKPRRLKIAHHATNLKPCTRRTEEALLLVLKNSHEKVGSV